MDDQQTAYRYIDSLLDDAIKLFGMPNTVPLNYSGGDIMFNGDVNKWIRFAWALKARYLNSPHKKRQPVQSGG